jgi:uncharacterized protein (TIGR02001 family)
MKTKHVTTHLILAYAILAVLSTAALAQDAAISTKLDAAYVSKYVWRGIPQTTDGAFQPSLTFTGNNGLSFNFWASQDSDKDEFTENDYTLNYSWSGGKAALNAGYIYYAFPNTSYLSTSEVYVSAGLSGPLSPTLAINYDIDEADGFYASLSGSHALPLGKGSTSLTLSGRIGLSSSGYNSFWFGEDSTALSDLYLSAGIPFAVGKVTLTPSLSYSTLLSSKLRNSPTMSGLKSNNFVVGLTASLGF